MFTYRNKKTGVIVVVPCEVAGDWELVSDAQSQPANEEKPKKKTSAKKKND